MSDARKIAQVLYFTARDCGHVVKLLYTRGGCDKNADFTSDGTRFTALHEAAWHGAAQSMLALL